MDAHRPGTTTTLSATTPWPPRCSRRAHRPHRRKVTPARIPDLRRSQAKISTQTRSRRPLVMHHLLLASRSLCGFRRRSALQADTLPAHCRRVRLKEWHRLEFLVSEAALPACCDALDRLGQLFHSERRRRERLRLRLCDGPLPEHKICATPCENSPYAFCCCFCRAAHRLGLVKRLRASPQAVILGITNR